MNGSCEVRMGKFSSRIGWALALLGAVVLQPASAATAAVGAAPKGDATTVASRIIKHNFPHCKKVSGAARAADGSIRARCDGTQYLVFSVFEASAGRMHEVALNCDAARKLLNRPC
jgi:hypothetical protein